MEIMETYDNRLTLTSTFHGEKPAMESQTAACETTAGHNLQCYQTVIHAVNPYTMKPPYTRTAWNRSPPPVASRFLFREVLEVLILGTPDPRDCKVFREIQVTVISRFCLRGVSLYYSAYIIIKDSK